MRGWQQEETGLVIRGSIKSCRGRELGAFAEFEFSKCLDLRGDAVTDPITLPIPVIKLSELFDALRTERQRLAAGSKQRAPRSNSCPASGPSGPVPAV